MKRFKRLKRLVTIFLASATLFTLFALTACKEDDDTLSEGSSFNGDQLQAVISIRDFGDITLELYPEYAPIAVKNFTDLVEDGYYEGKVFHRIIKDFMAQGGSPFGDGRGDPNYQFFSVESHPDATHVYGALCMANAGRDYNSQQFYIVNNKNGTHFLDGDYTVFGQTVDGFDVLDKISALETDSGDRPLTDVIIDSITIKNGE